MDALDRLYRRVVESLARAPREADRPLTVGEIYQTLVPYRLVRSEIGFSELAAYEHALLRLLSGERDYVFIADDRVREELLRELRSSNPILGIYRDYAHVEVDLDPDVPVPVVPQATPAEEVGSPPSPVSLPALAMDHTEPGAAAAAASVGPASPPAPAAQRCPGCRSVLPKSRDVRFCPFCAKPLRPVPCAECNAAIEPDWRFCGECGAARPAIASAPEQRLR